MALYCKRAMWESLDSTNLRIKREVRRANHCSSKASHIRNGLFEPREIYMIRHVCLHPGDQAGRQRAADVGDAALALRNNHGFI